MSPADLIDRVCANTGLSLAQLAERLGMKERSLKRIRTEEMKLVEGTKRHLLDIERIGAIAPPKNGYASRKTETPKRPVSRLTEEPAEYHRSGDESLRLVLARVTSKASINELAGMISEIAEDQDLAGPLRNRVVKILSEFIPERMK